MPMMLRLRSGLRAFTLQPRGTPQELAWRRVLERGYSSQKRSAAGPRLLYVLAVLAASPVAVTAAIQANSRSSLFPVLYADSGDNNDGWLSGPNISRPQESGHVIHDADHSRKGQQRPPPQARNHEGLEPAEGAESEDAWPSAVRRLSTVKDSFTGIDFTKLGDKLTDVFIPSWFKVLPGFIRKLQDEMSMSPGSLAEEIWRDANDPEFHPEIVWEANVRVSKDLCHEELDFLRKRKVRTTAALAKYLDVPENDVHPEDVPTIAMCGSGGGLRALVAGTSSFLSAQEAGLFDCVTYTAGVSGSCWLQAIFYSSIGQQNHAQMIHHLKQRLGVHIAFPPPALGLLSSAPTNKYLLSGIVEKLKGTPDTDVGIVDIYGLLLGARLLVPKGELRVDDGDLKLSNQRMYIDDGAYPLPIYTLVRHEIPDVARAKSDDESERKQANEEAWFQWFESTPYEFFCEEFEAGIPTWAFGRKFTEGKSVWRDNGIALPEIRVPLLMGVWGSAFCATLSHYYKEIRPVLRGLAGFAGIDQLLTERDDDLIKVHPIDPASVPNFALGMRDVLPANCPESIHTTANLQLMDAGMSNNLPIYPLLRPGRNVDVVIAFDASADVRNDNWIKVADSYVKQRGIKGWPVGAGWPPDASSDQQTADESDAAQAKTVQEVDDKTEEAQKKIPQDQGPMNQLQDTKAPSGLGYCTVWVGTTKEREVDSDQAPSSQVQDDWQVIEPDAGIAVIYLPLLPNPAVPGVDPQTSDFLSTWNFVYTPEQIDKVVNLARANFDAGREQTRRTVRAVWQRKRNVRLEKEKQAREATWRFSLSNVHGDHFS